jgi:Zn-dependent protease
MLSYLFSSPLVFFLSLIGLVSALTIHEYAHAFVADRLGDPTPRANKRLTLNPLAHLDPIGTITLFIVGFGWGKPVPIDPFNLRSPRQDTALISLAGPLSNLILAVTLSFLVKTFLSPIFLLLLTPTIIINISLAIFNLLPIHPLDGAKILSGLLPRDLAFEWESITSRYGTLILLILILPLFGNSLIASLISPVIQFISQFLL